MTVFANTVAPSCQPTNATPFDVPAARKLLRLPLTCQPDHNPMEANMAKGDQRNEKMTKKPKKDTSAPKAPVSSDRPMAPVTSVAPKGKLKNKPGA